MMNNICYMVQKVKDSNLGAVLGDNWIRAHRRKFRQLAMSYERASWQPVLAFLKDEGIHSRGSTTPSMTVLKERFKNFNLAFEEVYRTQTAWLVHNRELRDDLRISISVMVLQAYRPFMGRGFLVGSVRRDAKGDASSQRVMEVEYKNNRWAELGESYGYDCEGYLMVAEVVVLLKAAAKMATETGIEVLKTYSFPISQE
ncbi:hypothetical protein HPP92_007831 [Vanilla planifolia]|uniref:Exocyst subunit Exo70 family protein n=1 Tax=Vanilla planifolia TaxID=51239 RepID=A0A835RB60_VANPL|nr:hypothetical protein HPP92_007831 [Vanilla planifolia]